MLIANDILVHTTPSRVRTSIRTSTTHAIQYRVTTHTCNECVSNNFYPTETHTRSKYNRCLGIIITCMNTMLMCCKREKYFGTRRTGCRITTKTTTAGLDEILVAVRKQSFGKRNLPIIDSRNSTVGINNNNYYYYLKKKRRR